MSIQGRSNFSALLKRHRDAADMTQEELARRAGLGVRTVSNLERGVSVAPYRSTIRSLADALEIPEEDRLELAAAARQVEESSAPESVSTGERSTNERTTTIEGNFLGAVPARRLIARGRELETTILALEVVDREESGRTVFLLGEPGIGKTRLAQEISLRAWDRGFVVAAGRCYEGRSGVPFYPFLEALATLYEEAPEGVRQSVSERWPPLTRLLPDHFPHSNAPTTTSGDNQEELERLLRAVAGFIKAVAAIRPVALLLDDLHFADGASLDLLAHLARHTRSERVLILGTYRDVEVGSEHHLRRISRELDREELIEKIGVKGLREGETAELLSDRLDDSEVSGEFVELIHGRAGGNPFFTVEILSSLIERGELSLRAGRWTRLGALELNAPESVSDAISERVSRLAPHTKVILDEASALGQAFGFEDLRSLANREEGEVVESLDEASEAGLIREAKSGYTFNHALIQQALYSRLSPARRRRLHVAAGESLERLDERERRKRAAELSLHFVAGDLPHRALPYVLIAGDEAEVLFAHGEAERHYRSALELAGNTSDEVSRTTALERLGYVLATTVRYDEALWALGRAADAYRDRGDAEGQGRVEGRIARTHFRRGTQDEGITRLSAHLAALDKPDAPRNVRRGLAALYGGLGRLYYALGRYDKCRDAADRGATLSREVSEERSLAEAEMVRGTALLWLDSPDEAKEALERAIPIAERSGANDSMSTALLSLTMSCTRHGDFDRARKWGDRGVAVAYKAGDTDLLALHTSNVGLMLLYRGDWLESRAYLERAAQLSREGPQTLFSCLPPAYLGAFHQARGDWDEAENYFSEALDLALKIGRPQVVRYAHSRLAQQDVLRGRPETAVSRLEEWLDAPDLTWLYDVLMLSALAEGYADSNDPEAAGSVADRAIDRARATRNEVEGLEALRVKAKALALLDRPEEAAKILDAALATVGSMPYPHAEGRLLREYAGLHELREESGLARECLSDALRLFLELGASKDAHITKQALGRLSGQSVG